MRKIVISLVCIALFLAPAFAEIEEGNSEVMIGMSVDNSYAISSVGGYSSTMQMIRVTTIFSFGRFVTQASEVGLTATMLALTQKNISDAEAEWGGEGTLYLGPFYTHHFIGQDPRLVPYLGASLGKTFDLTFEDDAPKMWGLSLYGGLKYFLSEKTTIGPGLQYRMQKVTVEQDFGTLTGSNKSIIAMVNLGYLF